MIYTPSLSLLRVPCFIHSLQKYLGLTFTDQNTAFGVERSATFGQQGPEATPPAGQQPETEVFG